MFLSGIIEQGNLSRLGGYNALTLDLISCYEYIGSLYR